LGPALGLISIHLLDALAIVKIETSSTSLNWGSAPYRNITKRRITVETARPTPIAVVHLDKNIRADEISDANP
jgi:hypothetical protein